MKNCGSGPQLVLYDMRFMSLKVNVQSLGRIELQKLIAATVIPRFAANLVFGDLRE